MTESTISFASIWNTLSKIDCKGHTEQKTSGKDKFGNPIKLTYLSWTWAWGIAMKHYPDATYTIREWDGRPWLADPVAGYMVMTTVTIGGNTRMMWLPVMDSANNAMREQAYTYATRYGEKQVAQVDMMAINKAIMRCLVKNLAMFGLGLNIYAGEDLPVGADEDQKATPTPAAKTVSAKTKSTTKKHSPKATEAWAAFKACEFVSRLNESERNEKWRTILSDACGKATSAELTDGDWDKVMNLISVEKCL